jgi:phage tail tape-measure protein
MPRMNKAAATARRLPGFVTGLAVTTTLSMTMLTVTAPSGRAQGIVRGAQHGAYEGNRVAGPVGGVVGGAVGAGVGGAVGAVGIPHRTYRHHYRCRGYYDSYGYYHCFN